MAGASDDYQEQANAARLAMSELIWEGKYKDGKKVAPGVRHELGEFLVRLVFARLSDSI